MVAYARTQLKRLLEVEFVRFCIVGGTGFVVNFLILTVLHQVFAVPAFAAQFIAAEVALFSNFILHHRWTYRRHRVKKTAGQLLAQFHVTSWPAILGSSVMVGAGVYFLHLNDFMALAVSSAIALFWNFAWSKYVVWRDVPADKVNEIVRKATVSKAE